MDPITLRETAPKSEYDKAFFQGMVDRMGVSYHKYGKVRDNFPEVVNALENVQRRIEKYERTGNTEFLVDAANFLMIEYMRPSHPEAHYRATPSEEAPKLIERRS